MCDCWVGILNSYDQSETNNLCISNIVSRLKEVSHYSCEMAKASSHFKAFIPSDYIDRRRGLATLFKFCPWCGEEIKWSKLRKKIITSKSTRQANTACRSA